MLVLATTSSLCIFDPDYGMSVAAKERDFGTGDGSGHGIREAKREEGKVVAEHCR